MHIDFSTIAQISAAIFTVLLSIVLIAALGLLLYAFLRELRRNALFLDPIDVPRTLDARGYSPTVVAERMLDALLGMRRKVPTLPELRGVEANATIVDLHTLDRFSLQAMARHIHRLLRIPETHVGREITRESGS